MMRAFILVLFLLPLGTMAQTARFPSSVATDSDLLVQRDRAQSVLAGNISPSSTVIPVEDGSRFAANMVVTIDDEQIKLAGVAGNNLFVSQRGFGGTQPAPHAKGALVRGHVVAWHHNALREEVKAIEQALGANLSNVAKRTSSTSGAIPLWDASGGLGNSALSETTSELSSAKPVNAPVWDKSGAVYNVRAYGAKGDGVTDDANAIQNAINAAISAGGGVVVFPKSSSPYLVGQTLTISNAVNLQLEGNAILKQKDGSNLNQLILITNSTGVRVRGLELDGNRWNQTSGLNRGIEIVDSRDTRIENVTVHDFGLSQIASYGILALDSPNTSVRGSRFWDNGWADVACSTYAGPSRKWDDGDSTTARNSDGCSIQDNILGEKDIALVPTSPPTRRRNPSFRGILVEWCKNVVVSGNKIYGATRVHGTTPKFRGTTLTTFNVRNATVANNIVDGMANGHGLISVTQGSGVITGTDTDFNTDSTGVLSDLDSYLLIEGDTTVYRVTEVRSSTEIVVTPPVVRATASGLRYKMNYANDLTNCAGCHNVTWIGNVVSYGHDNGISVGGDDPSGSTFRNNTFIGNVSRNNCTSGMVVVGEAIGNTIVGNVFINNGQCRTEVAVSDDYRSGIHFLEYRGNDGPIRHNVIVGNLIADFQDSPTQQYGIREEGTGYISNNVYLGNKFYGNAIAHLSAPSVSQTGVNIANSGDSGVNYLLAPLKVSETIFGSGNEGDCSAANRGRVVMVHGGAGVADTLRICAKDETDNYVWKPLY